MKWHNWLYLIFYSPGAALGVLWVHHIVEVFVLHENSDSIHDKEQPWWFFSAFMSVLLFGFHMYVFFAVLLRKYKISWMLYAGTHPERTEIFMIMLDCSWSVLWLLQLIVQLLLTRRHRLYTVRKVFVMLGLYVFQLLVAIPLLVFIFRRWKALRRKRAINSDDGICLLKDNAKALSVRAVVRG